MGIRKRSPSQPARPRASAPPPVSAAAKAEIRDLRRQVAELQAQVGALESSRFEAEIYRARFADLYSFAPVGYLTLDALGRVIDLNLSAATLLGRSRQGMLQMPFAVCVERSSLSGFLEYLRKCRESHGALSCELEIRRAKGVSVPVQLLTTRMPRGPHSAPLHLTAMIDLTERKELERTLRDSEEWLRMALRCANAGIWDFEVGANRAIWSPEFYKLLGLDAGSVHPSEEALLSVMSPKDRRAAGKLLAAALSGDLENFQAEYRINPPGGGVRWLAMFGRLVRGSRERPARVTGIGVDITAQKRVEELLRKARETLEQRVKERTADLLAAKTTLEKEMADRQRLERQLLEVSEREQRRIGRDLHDGLGQQIGGIIFHAHLLEKRLAENGREEAAAAARIVALLDEAKIQARRIARGLQPVGPESDGLMAGLGHFAVTASDLYRIQCTFVCPEPVLVEEHSTAVHLFRIAQESVANAFRHGGASAIEVSLRSSGGWIELEISDDGKGLPKRPRRESGLGLRFMEYRAEAIGGMLKVLPGVSGGAVIHCSVPVANGKA